MKKYITLCICIIVTMTVCAQKNLSLTNGIIKTGIGNFIIKTTTKKVSPGNVWHAPGQLPKAVDMDEDAFYFISNDVVLNLITFHSTTQDGIPVQQIISIVDFGNSLVITLKDRGSFKVSRSTGDTIPIVTSM